MLRIFFVVLLLFQFLGLAAGCVAAPFYIPGTTRKMFQLTGDTDQPLRRSTRSLTQTRAGLRATDLGNSFEHEGNLYFLFGDSFGSGRVANLDCFATSSATNSEDLVLDFPLAEDGKYLPITIPGISQGAMEVPTCGISVCGEIYIVHTTDWNGATGNMDRSVLAKSSDLGQSWSLIYDLSAAQDGDITNAHFINASMAKVAAEAYPGDLPYATGEIVLLWGSGAYRRSNVYLACIPSAQIEDRSALRFYCGLDSGNRPRWSEDESVSVALFTHPYVGEFSAAWIEPVKRWLILYNADSPRGITMRSAEKPWGPFSGGSVILDPWKEPGYGRYLHVPWNWVHADAFQDSGGDDVWGGEYGPYIIPRFASGTPERCEIYYAMSTWNPYQSVLMRSDIGVSKTLNFKQAKTRLMPGDSSWQISSTTFFAELTGQTKPYITTLGTRGVRSTGWMWTRLPRDNGNARLTFEVHGGTAEVVLIEGGGDIPTSGVSSTTLYSRVKNGEFGDVVQCTWGHKSDDIKVSVDWSLAPFDSANLKVLIIDNSSSSWGYVNVSEMTLTRNIANHGDLMQVR